jgi:formylglycine-generating enzyme
VNAAHDAKLQGAALALLLASCASLVGITDITPAADAGADSGSSSGGSSGGEAGSSGGDSGSGGGVDGASDAPDSEARCTIGVVESCPSGEVCTGNPPGCVAGCWINGVFQSPNATANSGCEVCDPGTSTSSWSPVSGAASCPSGQVCISGACSPGCSIGGTSYASSAPDPADTCQTCQPATSASAWTTLAPGDTCGSGEVCNGSPLSCVGGCWIAGTFYPPGTASAASACQTCQPGTSTTAFSPATGTSCAGSGTCSSGSCVMPPSCAPGGPGMSTCPAGTGSESCCTSLPVTGGTYDRTYDPSGSDGGVPLAADGGPTGEADPATISSLRLDKYLVTVGRFRQFVSAWNGGAGYTPPAGSGIHTYLNGGQGLANSASLGTYEPGWAASDDTDVAPTNTNLGGSYCTWTTTAGSQESLPINCTNWYEAYAFCIWDGGFLPSEAEWGYAAAGGSQQRVYPWGSTPPGASNQYAIYGGAELQDCYYPSGTLTQCTGVTNIAPVGTATLGAGVWGQLDLMGDLQEWTLDYFNTFVDPCTDCAYATPVGSCCNKSVRGAPYDAPLPPPFRGGLAPTGRFADNGFRCARVP